jgi:ubiquinone/menaquinone biosynthesis C-methylase UbiE
MDYYDKIAKGYNELHQKEQENKLRIIKAHFDLGPHDILLDVGCGTGISSEVFKCQIVGLEPAKEMLAQSRKENTSNMEFLQGEGEYLPFSNNSFDAIICVTALHNFKDPKAGLEEIKRVGKGKGAITILKKAKYAKDLKDSVNEILKIEKEIEEDKDIILFFDLGKL